MGLWRETQCKNYWSTRSENNQGCQLQRSPLCYFSWKNEPPGWQNSYHGNGSEPKVTSLDRSPTFSIYLVRDLGRAGSLPWTSTSTWAGQCHQWLKQSWWRRWSHKLFVRQAASTSIQPIRMSDLTVCLTLTTFQKTEIRNCDIPVCGERGEWLGDKYFPNLSLKNSNIQKNRELTFCPVGFTHVLTR